MPRDIRTKTALEAAQRIAVIDAQSGLYSAIDRAMCCGVISYLTGIPHVSIPRCRRVVAARPDHLHLLHRPAPRTTGGLDL